MANKKISEFNPVDVLEAEDAFVIARAGTNRRVPLSQIAQYILDMIVQTEPVTWSVTDVEGLREAYEEASAKIVSHAGLITISLAGTGTSSIKTYALGSGGPLGGFPHPRVQLVGPAMRTAFPVLDDFLPGGSLHLSNTHDLLADYLTQRTFAPNGDFVAALEADYAALLPLIQALWQVEITVDLNDAFSLKGEKLGLAKNLLIRCTDYDESGAGISTGQNQGGRGGGFCEVENVAIMNFSNPALLIDHDGLINTVYGKALLAFNEQATRTDFDGAIRSHAALCIGSRQDGYRSNHGGQLYGLDLQCAYNNIAVRATNGAGATYCQGMVAKYNRLYGIQGAEGPKFKCFNVKLQYNYQAALFQRVFDVDIRAIGDGETCEISHNSNMGIRVLDGGFLDFDQVGIIDQDTGIIGPPGVLIFEDNNDKDIWYESSFLPAELPHIQIGADVVYTTNLPAASITPGPPRVLADGVKAKTMLAASWTSAASGLAALNFDCLVYHSGNGRAVAVARSSTDRVYTTDNAGGSWTNHGPLGASDESWGYGFEMLGVGSGDYGRLVITAAGGTRRLAYIDNGVSDGSTGVAASWTYPTVLDSDGNPVTLGALRGGAYSVRLRRGMIMGNAAAGVSYDADTDEWLEVTGLPSGARDVEYVPWLNTFLGVSNNVASTNQMFTSDDGRLLALIDSGVQAAFVACAVGEHLQVFVAVASDGTIAYTYEGEALHVATVLSGVTLANVCYAREQGLFFATASTGQVYWSANGVKWTSMSVPEANEWNNVVALRGHNKILAVAGSGTNRAMTLG